MKINVEEILINIVYVTFIFGIVGLFIFPFFYHNHKNIKYIPSKYDVTITINFSEKTLVEIAEIEKNIKQKYGNNVIISIENSDKKDILTTDDIQGQVWSPEIINDDLNSELPLNVDKGALTW